jgi:hypothetical protein
MSLVRKLGHLTLVIIAGLARVPSAQAQEFSASIVTTTAHGETRAKLSSVRVMNGRVRFETPDLPSGFFLLNKDPDGAYFVRPAARIFMDAGGSSRLTQYFVSVDPDDPCPRWQAMAKAAGAIASDAQAGVQWHCARIDGETIDGRDTIHYQATTYEGQQRSGWIDPHLQFPLKVVAEDGTTYQLTNITEAPQPASWFEIPADFRKFDPRQLIERLKHSDVWVKPPNAQTPRE